MEEISWQGGEARRYFWNRKTPSSPLLSSGIRNTSRSRVSASQLELSLSLFLSSLEFVEISPRPASPSIHTHDILRPFSSQRERKHTRVLRVTNQQPVSNNAAKEDYEDRCRFGWRNDGKKYTRTLETFVRAKCNSRSESHHLTSIRGN